MNDDPDLVRKAARGDRTSFRQLYERHRANVARLVFRMLSGSRDVEDVVQEVFLQVHRSLPDFNGTAKFSTWLHRVAINVVLMHRRAKKSRPTFADEERVVAEAPDRGRLAPDEAAARRERIRAFFKLLDRLAEKKRVVFVLHELEGMAPAEIAKVVVAPVLTVRTRLFYARRELGAMMAEEPQLAGVGLELGLTPGEEG